MPKKKGFRYYWEEPAGSDKRQKTPGKPLEFTFTFPKMQFPAMKVQMIQMNISETDKDIIVRAGLPGFKKNDINLNVTESTVEISASKKEERKEHGEKYFRHESRSGSVHRAFTLPGRVDPDKTHAKLEGGLLTIVIPKLEPALSTPSVRNALERKKKKKIGVK